MPPTHVLTRANVEAAQIAFPAVVKPPRSDVEDANGNPYVGAKLYVYVPGTTTPAAIYADAALSIPLANPLSGATGSDAAGNFPRAYIAAGAYKLRAETAAGILIWQEDNIDTGLSAGSTASSSIPNSWSRSISPYSCA